MSGRFQPAIASADSLQINMVRVGISQGSTCCHAGCSVAVTQWRLFWMLQMLTVTAWSMRRSSVPWLHWSTLPICCHRQKRQRSHGSSHQKIWKSSCCFFFFFFVIVAFAILKSNSNLPTLVNFVTPSILDEHRESEVLWCATWQNVWTNLRCIPGGSVFSYRLHQPRPADPVANWRESFV